MFEIIIAFCITLVEAPKYKGGESVLGFYKPKIDFVDERDCKANVKLIDEWFIKQAERLYPEHKKIQAKGLCVNKIKIN